MAYFEVLFHYSLGKIEENHEKLLRITSNLAEI